MEQLADLCGVVRAKGSRGTIHWDELMDHRFITEKALELWWDDEMHMWQHDARHQGTTFAMSKAEAAIYDRREWHSRDARGSTQRR